MSPFSTIVDLVDDDGRAQAALMLADDGDGWFVHVESVCPMD